MTVLQQAGGVRRDMLSLDYGDTLWTPSAEVAERAVSTRYARWLTAERGVQATGSYQDLWQWSVSEPAGFWSSILTRREQAGVLLPADFRLAAPWAANGGCASGARAGP
jgi:hypothetical protein